MSTCGLRLLSGVILVTSLWSQERTRRSTEAENAIDEFRAQTRALGLARLGVTLHTGRPGDANGWHGRLYENFRNDVLDAVPHEVREGGLDKSLLRRNQFGFNFSGPVPRLQTGGSRKVYVSLSYEGVRQTIDRPNRATVPTLLERTGDFSATVDSAGLPLPIYDPSSTRTNPSFDPSQSVSAPNLEYERSAFPGNRIPVSRLDPVALKALAYYPAPNAAIGPFFQNNYFVNTPEGDDADGFTGTAEVDVTPQSRLFISPSLSNGSLNAAPLFPTEANPGAADRSYRDRRARLQEIYSSSGKLLNNFSFVAARAAWKNGRQLLDDPADTLGLAGIDSAAFPYFRLGNYLSMGLAYPYSTTLTDGYTFTDSVSYRVGKHQLGLDARHSRYYVEDLAPAYPSGAFTFTSWLTSVPGIVDEGLPFASFLLGMPETAQATTISSPSHFLRTETALGLHDQFQVLRNLSITAGVNLTRTTPRTERYNHQSNIDLKATDPASGNPGALVVAGANGRGRGLQPTRYRAEPTFALAWDFAGDRTTVLRAGFNRSYLPITNGSLQYNTQGFNSFSTIRSTNPQLFPALLLASGFPPPAHPLNYTGPDAADGTIADYLDPTSLQPMQQSAMVSVEHGFGSTLLTAAFTYGGGRSLLVGNSAADPNTLPLSALQYRDALNILAFSQALRPYPQFLDFNLNGSYPAGRNQRDAASIRIEKRASHGIAVDVTGTFGKEWDDYSGPYGLQDFFNRRNDWSLTPGMRARTLQIDYVWELPIGRGHRLLNYNGWRDRLVEGWSLSGSSAILGGTPIELVPLFNNTGGVVTGLTVDSVPGVNPTVSNPNANLWYNPAAFVQPPDFALGSVSRTLPNLRNPIHQNHDLAIRKRMALDTRRTLEMSVLALNILNHANLNNPDPVIGSVLDPNADAGRIIGSTGGRVVQLTMQITF